MRPRRRPFAAAMPRRCWGCSGRGTKHGLALAPDNTHERSAVPCPRAFLGAGPRITAANSDGAVTGAGAATAAPRSVLRAHLRRHPGLDQRPGKHISVKRKCWRASFVVDVGRPWSRQVIRLLSLRRASVRVFPVLSLCSAVRQSWSRTASFVKAFVLTGGGRFCRSAMLSFGDARSFDAQVEACLLGSRFRLLITKLVRDAFGQ